MIELPLKNSVSGESPDVVSAEIDRNIPKDARKHYRDAKKAQKTGKSDVAIAELQQALKIHAQYYSARLDLSREFRVLKRYAEAEESVKMLEEMTPKRAEPRVEYGLLLMAANRSREAALKLAEAVQLEEKDWSAHLYLGWVLQDMDVATAERHFKRALEIDESNAAKAYVGLARIAHARGQTQTAIEHLDAYLRLAPNSPDAESVRKLAERLRAKQP
jgi:tetratricopeptide (TPR) repeat protein